MQAIAEELDCSRITIQEWMKELDTETRSVIESPPEEWMNGAEHRNEYGYSPHVRHPESIRELDDPDEANTMDDLITPCHARHVSTEAGTEEVGR